MLQMIARGRVVNGGPVVIETPDKPPAVTTAERTDPEPDKGFLAYLRCLEREGLPASWADEFVTKG
jgi:hypothetical protein